MCRRTVPLRRSATSDGRQANDGLTSALRQAQTRMSLCGLRLSKGTNRLANPAHPDAVLIHVKPDF